MVLVVSFARQVEKVNIFKEEDILEPIRSSDVVMVCLGGPASLFGYKAVTIHTESTEVILSAMRKAGKRRFIVISAGGSVCKCLSKSHLLITSYR